MKMLPPSGRLRPTVFLALALAWIAGPSGRAAALNVRDFGAKADGQTNDMSAIQRAIDAAARQGPGAVVSIPSGHYRLIPANPGQSSHLELRNVRGLAIRGEPDTYLDCADPDCHVFRIQDSADITISSLKLDRHPFVFTQGLIQSISAQANTVDVIIDEGYDEPDSKYLARLDFFMAFVDPATGTWHHDANWPPLIQRRERLGNRQWRLTLNRPPEAVFLGKPFVIWKNVYKGWAFSMYGSRNILIEDVAYYAGGGQAGFVINHCEGDISFKRFSVAVPPGSGRRFASAGGAMVFNNRIKLLVDGCEFAATDDDGINMGTNSSHILQQLDPRTLRIEAGADRADYRPGDRVELWDWVTKSARTEARVDAVSRTDHGLDVRLDRDVKVERVGVGPWAEFIASKPKGDNSEEDREAKHAARRANEKDGIDRLINLDNAGTAIIRNSRFQSFRSRNLLIKTSDTLIENNVFHDTVMASILVGPEFYWDEGPATRHLVIRNNRFENVSGSNIIIGAHFSDQSFDNRDITIEGNTFVNYGQVSKGVAGKQGSPIYVRNADGVIIKDNIMGPPNPDSPDVPRILVEVSKNVTESGNQITGTLPAAK